VAGDSYCRVGASAPARFVLLKPPAMKRDKDIVRQLDEHLENLPSRNARPVSKIHRCAIPNTRHGMTHKRSPGGDSTAERRRCGQKVAGLKAGLTSRAK